MNNEVYLLNPAGTAGAVTRYSGLNWPVGDPHHKF